MDGWTGEEGVVVFGRDPPRAVVEAVVDASCSRVVAGSPCRNFYAKMNWVYGFYFFRGELMIMHRASLYPFFSPSGDGGRKSGLILRKRKIVHCLKIIISNNTTLV